MFVGVCMVVKRMQQFDSWSVGVCMVVKRMQQFDSWSLFVPSEYVMPHDSIT
jgi:hypothetical protein